MKTGMRFFMILVMLSSLGIYLDLNSDKVVHLSRVYDEISNGESALDVDLKVNSESVVQHRLRSSNLFDAAGTRQVSFLGLDPDSYAKVAGNIAELQLSVDGSDVPFETMEQGKAVQLMWADRKLNIVPSGDMQVVAESITYENENRPRWFSCFNKRFCRSIRVSTEGIGPLEGPYLGNELNKLKRGLPRGSWAYGPYSSISISSDISTEAVIGISVLRLSEDQQLNIEGPVLGQRSLPSEEFVSPYGGLQLYPEEKRVKIRLRPGVNEIKLVYSKWMGLIGHDERPEAVYITSIKIMPISS